MNPHEAPAADTAAVETMIESLLCIIEESKDAEVVRLAVTGLAASTQGLMAMNQRGWGS